MSFSKEDCEYTKFNIENHKVEFSVSGEDGILISIPFADDTPQCIKDRLNDIIHKEMSRYLETERCMSMPCRLRLNASMQVQYHNDEGADPQYYISMVITDIPEIEAGTWIEKSVDILSEETELRNEFIPYCQYRLNRLLFPFHQNNQTDGTSGEIVPVSVESGGDGCYNGRMSQNHEKGEYGCLRQ